MKTTAKQMLKNAATNPDALDRLAAAPLERVLELVFWKLRHKNPDMAVLIDKKDIEAFEQSMAYQEIKPGILVERPAGRPGHPAIPAAGKRRAVPEVQAEAPRPFVLVALVEAGTKNTVKPVENNEEDFQRGDLCRKLAAARGKTQNLAQMLRNAAANPDLATSGTLEEAAEILALLGRAT